MHRVSRGSRAGPRPGGRALRVGVEAGLQVALLGGALWATGLPFVFPSLGPTAFVLATRSGTAPAREVLGGHLCGVAAGLLAYHTLAPGLALTDALGPLSEGGLRLAASGALSVALTAGAMVRLRAVHGPACATTLIVALGVLPGLREAVVILAAVAGMYGAHVASRGRQARG